ncbi:MAG TPA: hypothetical protein VIH59_10280 [Candidatus Tectomicrobia bacterium]|jgi:hypothetical protein
MRIKLGWVLAALVDVTGGRLIVYQPSWWYPNQHRLVAATTPVEPNTSPPTSPPSLSFLSPEVKELSVLYQRSAYHLPRPVQNFLLERLHAWPDLSPDMRAETVAILQQLSRLDRHQALVYVQRLWTERNHSKVGISEDTISVK